MAKDPACGHACGLAPPQQGKKIGAMASIVGQAVGG